MDYLVTGFGGYSRSLINSATSLSEVLLNHPKINKLCCQDDSCKSIYSFLHLEFQLGILSFY